METTTVFSIRSLTTLPTRSFLRLRSTIIAVMRLLTSFERETRRDDRGAPDASGLRGRLPFVQHRQQARHLAPALTDAQRIVELLHRVAEAQVEHLLAQLGNPPQDLVGRLIAQRRRLHVSHVTLLPVRGVPRTACGSAASRRQASSLRAPAASKSLPARTSPDP